MSNEDSPPPSPMSARRASFSPGQTFSELFNRSGSTSNNSGTTAYPGSIASAAANAQTRRRVSISTLGLSGSSPTQTSPWSAASIPGRRTSISSVATGSSAIDENAIEEGDAVSMPSTPFGRRISFGAKAMQSVRGGAGSGPGRSSSVAGSPTGKAREAFSWSESLRSRAESSFERTGASGHAAGTPHTRAQSVATVPTPAQPPQEIPKTFKPDAFQERILKGDFYMD